MAVRIISFGFLRCHKTPVASSIPCCAALSAPHGYKSSGLPCSAQLLVRNFWSENFALIFAFLIGCGLLSTPKFLSTFLLLFKCFSLAVCTMYPTTPYFYLDVEFGRRHSNDISHYAYINRLQTMVHFWSPYVSC